GRPRRKSDGLSAWSRRWRQLDGKRLHLVHRTPLLRRRRSRRGTVARRGAVAGGRTVTRRRTIARRGAVTGGRTIARWRTIARRRVTVSRWRAVPWRRIAIP